MLDILLAVDGSEASLRATAKLAEMANWWKVRHFHLLNVQPEPPAFAEPLPYAIQQQAEALARAAGERTLDAARVVLKLLPPPTSAVESGDPATVIARTAEQRDSTIIALGHHGAGALASFLMGPVTTRVLHLTSRLVLVIPSAHLRAASAYGPPRRPVRILMPVDGSAGAVAALRQVVRLAQSFVEFPEIHLLAVYHGTPLDVEIGAMVSEKAVTDHERLRFEAALEPARSVLAEAKLTATEHTAIGPPAHRIHAAVSSLGCDLVCVGMRGTGTVRNLVPGSAVAKLLHLAEVPVLVVPSPSG